METKVRFLFLASICIFAGSMETKAQDPYRVGTTAANFLEIGYGPAGISLGDAYVSLSTDLSAVYWNPGGLAFMRGNAALFTLQPWIVETNSSFTAVGINLPRVGTLALSMIHIGFGEMEVTTLNQQEGTGERFDANEFAVTLTYGRALTDWFGVGVGVKYISSQIWHTQGSAVAFDLGIMIHTEFFALTDKPGDGMRIGMSIANYGTKLRYDGMDLLFPIDILSDENGNYKDVPGQFKMSGWELPMIFRVGVSIKPLVFGHQSLTLAVDALHPNNNSESLNAGVEYTMDIPSFGSFSLRGGYKGLLMDSSEYGPTFGAGFILKMLHNSALRFDYAYRNLGIMGMTHCYGVQMCF